MKTIVISYILFVMSIFTCNNICGQEYIKQLYGFDDNNPVIREWGNLRVMVATDKQHSHNICHFHLFDDNVSYVQIEEIGVNEVNDFEVVNDTVFFCGNIIDNNNTVAGVVGYFDLNLFPNAPVTVVTVDNCKTLNKMATKGLAKGIYATATDNGGMSRIVEVHRKTVFSSVLWYVFTTTGDDGTGLPFVFDDVEMLDQQLVVAARQRVGIVPNDIDAEDESDYGVLLCSSNVLFFDYSNLFLAMPLYTSIPVISQYTLKNLSYIGIHDQIVLETCGNNWFVATELTKVKTMNPYHLCITAFYGMNPQYTIWADTVGKNCNLIDVSFNDYSRILDVVLYDNSKTRSVIYNFNQSMTILPGTATGRYFNNYKLNSICYLTSKIDNFLAVGTELSNFFYRYLFGYHFSTWPGCSGAIKTSTRPVEYEEITSIVEPPFTRFMGSDKITPSQENDKCEVSTICFARDTIHTQQ